MSAFIVKFRRNTGAHIRKYHVQVFDRVDLLVPYLRVACINQNFTF